MLRWPNYGTADVISQPQEPRGSRQDRVTSPCSVADSRNHGVPHLVSPRTGLESGGPGIWGVKTPLLARSARLGRRESPDHI
ncbi:hypothetical protein MTO96_012656 [Rhipicephalus appendiculatus]